MTDGAVFITMASWEERFILGSRRLFEQHRPSRAILYYADEYEVWSGDNRLQFGDLCKRHDVLFDQHVVFLKSPAKTWETLRRDLASQTIAARELVVDITTMPRDIIWQVFAFGEHMKCSLKYVYHRPGDYNKEWLSRDPERPRLVYKLSGEAEFGRPTTLIILTGYDVRRTEQLIRFYEPKTTLLGIQTGSQFGNQAQNIDVHLSLISPESGVAQFDIDAYSEDRGKAVIEEQLVPHLIDANVVMSSLGPKLSAVALYQLHKLHPSTSLSYAPSQEYNPEYSTGLGETFYGQV
ncbi:MAG: hypothetical protein WBX00_33555 [Isosphaeraceae bacterium]